jgi:hypothetical protein
MELRPVKKSELKTTPLPIDRWADYIAKAATGSDEKMLTVRQMTEWLRVTEQWLAKLRLSPNGPPFVVLPGIASRHHSDGSIRYPQSQVKIWLKERMYASTAEYKTGSDPRKLVEA